MRKSIFQRLEPWTNRRVCDLYAGIGALGIEALSRGAAGVVFVENNRQVLDVLERNLSRVRSEAETVVARMETDSFLATTAQHFDVVLADPPYNTAGWEDLQPQVERVLAPGGVFVMELSRKTSVPNDIDVRTFGKTKVGLWRKAT